MDECDDKWEILQQERKGANAKGNLMDYTSEEEEVLLATTKPELGPAREVANPFWSHKPCEALALSPQVAVY